MPYHTSRSTVETYVSMGAVYKMNKTSFISPNMVIDLLSVPSVSVLRMSLAYIQLWDEGREGHISLDILRHMTPKSYPTRTSLAGL